MKREEMEQKFKALAAAMRQSVEVSTELGTEFEDQEMLLLAFCLKTVTAALSHDDLLELAVVLERYVDDKLAERAVSKLKSLGLDGFNLN
jgi:hypothetical protein